MASDKHSQKMDELKDMFLSMNLNEKRKLYRCKDSFQTLESIPPWHQYVQENGYLVSKMQSMWWSGKESKKTAKDFSVYRSDLNSKISIFTGDITTLEIDAITNAANGSLLGGGGVDGAIHAAAGPKLRCECELLNGCSVGDAKLTCGYKLPARYVLHTVGPRGENPEMLENCYKTCLNLVKENGLKTVAFPCISTGIYGYPNEKAARVALGTIRTWLEENDEYTKKLERIILCLFLKKDIDIYIQQMQFFFPHIKPGVDQKPETEVKQQNI